MTIADDESYLRRALELAQEAAGAGDVPIGAVLISGDLQLEAKNEKEARSDPTAHAEMLLLREAARRLGAWRLSQATVYVTKEPCVMCAGALIAARVQTPREVRTAAHSISSAHPARIIGRRLLRAFWRPRQPNSCSNSSVRNASRARKRYSACALKHSGGEVVEWLKAPASKAGER
jgi:pyrimidine deaminase RibD-like protein